MDIRKIWAIALNCLTRTARDKNGLLITLLMPMIIIAILGTALGGMFKAGTIEPFRVVLVNDDKPAKPAVAGLGAFSQLLPSYNFGNILVDEVFNDKNVKEIIDSKTRRNLDKAMSDVAEAKAAAVVHVPPAFSADVLSGRSAHLDIVADPGKPMPADITGKIVTGFTDSVTSGMVASKLLGMDKGRKISGSTEWMPSVRRVASGTRDVSAMQYYAAAMAIMFMVMTALSRGVNILREHETGTLPRILVSPTSKSAVLAGHIAGSLLIVLAQFIILMLGTHFIYGVNWGGWLPAILLGGTFSFAATGIGLALASLFREPKAADSSIGLIGNIFAALSGSMFPIYAFSDSMKTLAKAVPNYWALQGFIDQMGGMGLSHIVLPIVVLAALGIISGFVGTLRLGKR